MLDALAAPINDAALAFCESELIDGDHQDCRALILFFLGQPLEAGIAQQLRPRANGTLRSLKSSNILRKREDITYIDFWAAVGAVVADVFAAGDPKKLVLAIIGGSVFFLKRVRELASIDLTLRESSVVLALHDASAQHVEITVDGVLPFYDQIAGSVPGVQLGREELEAGLRSLQRLGVVICKDDKWTLVEQVALKKSK